MPGVLPKDLLSHYPSVHTTDPDEFHHALTTIYGATSLTIPAPQGLRAYGSFFKSSDLSFGFSSCAVRAEVVFGECDYARLQIGLAGSATTTSAGTTSIVDHANSCVTSPGRASVLDYGEGFEQIVLRISVNALKRKLTTLLGISPSAPLAFEPNACADVSADRALRNLLIFTMRQIDECPEGLPPLVMKKLEQAIIATFLTARTHTYSGLLMRESKDAAPWQVRRAEAYIEANWKEPITIEMLSEETGVSVRTLFATFQKSRGYTPMQFAKTVRLKGAQKMLQSESRGTSVTGVAFACGFANPGHFAREYRTMFGELPSETLARGKRPIV